MGRRLRAIANHIGAHGAAAAVHEQETQTETQRRVGPDEQALLATAEALFPGGTPNGNSTAKGFVFDRGEGAYVWDKTGNKFLDLAMGSGPMFIGHAHPRVVAAIQRRAAKGATSPGR
jgi:glutamate-1-semialdehyde aminotransferase